MSRQHSLSAWQGPGLHRDLSSPKQRPSWCGKLYKLFGHYCIVWIALFGIQCSTHFALVKIHTRSNFTIHDNTFSWIEYLGIQSLVKFYYSWQHCMTPLWHLRDMLSPAAWHSGSGSRFLLHMTTGSRPSLRRGWTPLERKCFHISDLSDIWV